ncbi:glycosyltransferase [Bellilinea sp.]|uniref:glycosyltransferase n=1 Tax=Bellilinea sp. TaxID=2838785 RepID=UPI002ADE5657|nr:glycosyltransferase [Bellilinea sp.]
MKVLYFSRDYTPHDHRFLSALAQTPHTIYYLRLERQSRQLEDRPLPPQVEQVVWQGGRQPVGWRDYPRLLSDLRRVIRRLQPDVIHAGPIQSAAFLAALSGFRPLVSMSWGSDLLLDADRSAWMRWVTRFTLRRTTVLAADCRTVLEKAAQFGFPPQRVVLFPWGVELARFQPGRADAFRARRGWQDAFVVLSLRTWEPLYGVDVVARGFARAARQNPRLRLLLLGGGSQAGLIRSIFEQEGVQEQVFFGGQVNGDDLPQYYQEADLYVSASHSDGSSVSLMEALASGLPVLVSDIPSNREWITPGREGWLFADGDDRALSEGILRAAGQPEGLKEMRLAARRLAEERANWQVNFQRLLDAYQLALEIEQLSASLHPSPLKEQE